MTDERVFAKCAWRLIPLMALLYLANFLDRTNVGFAALTMNRDLQFTPAVYGFGAGVFFFGYALFQVPANLVLARVGARRWIALILAVWGILSAACALVQGSLSFYVLRFALGVAEAGFFPGMIFYMTLWFPRTYRTRFTAGFMTAIPLAFIIGGPLSGAILSLNGVAGLRGWQWLFLLEGLPAFLLAFVVLKFLADEPASARWLTDDEKNFIANSLLREHAATEQLLWPVLLDFRILALGVVNFGVQAGIYGATFWLPQIVQTMGFSNLATGFILVLPFTATMAAMLFWGRSSDARDERIWHVAGAALLAASGFAAAGLSTSVTSELIALSLAVIGVISALPPMFSLPSTFLRGTAAAGGIALFNSVGLLGGFVGPYMVGAIRERTGAYGAAMMLLAGFLALSDLAVLLLGRRSLKSRVTVEINT